jgi:transcriptional regulator with XRE-family HTH domain
LRIEAPGVTEFAAWWPKALQRSGLSAESVAYRICQDLEARLGIAQGKVAAPDYRDYLADLIDERHGSRYRFCEATGIDPGHLSRIFSDRSELSLETLQRILEQLDAALVIESGEVSAERCSPERAVRALVAAVR